LLSVQSSPTEGGGFASSEKQARIELSETLVRREIVLGNFAQHNIKRFAFQSHPNFSAKAKTSFMLIALSEMPKPQI